MRSHWVNLLGLGESGIREIVTEVGYRKVRTSDEFDALFEGLGVA